MKPHIYAAAIVAYKGEQILGIKVAMSIAISDAKAYNNFKTMASNTFPEATELTVKMKDFSVFIWEHSKELDYHPKNSLKVKE